MSHSVQMPALGESVTEGTVTRWLKQVGDEVAVDEPLVEISTDKVDTEIPSPFAGILEKIVVAEDETAEVGAELAVIGDGSGGAGADGDQADGASPAAAEPQQAEPEQAEAQQDEPQQSDAEQDAEPEPEAAPAAAGQAADAPSTETDQPAEKPMAQTGSAAGAGTPVMLPEMGESVTEGTITRWLKQVGDEVAVDEALVEVSTDKVDTEVPSPIAGTLLEITVGEDETIQVGGQLGVIGDKGAAPAAAPKPQTPEPEARESEAPKVAAPKPAEPKPAEGKPEAVAEPAAAPEEEPGSAPPPAPATSAGLPAAEAATPAAAQSPAKVDWQPPAKAEPSGYVTPVIRKLAADSGVELADVKGSGVGGRIRREDVVAAAAEAKAAAERAAAEKAATEKAATEKAATGKSGPDQAAKPAAGAKPDAAASALIGSTQKLPRIRQSIARNMVNALHTSAQLTTVVEVDVTKVAKLRQQAKSVFESREGVKLSFLPFFVKAAVEAAKQYPVINSSISDDLKEITYHPAVNLGIAVDTPRGLIVPVIKSADDLNIGGIARKIAELAARTRDNKIGPDELSGGTFTVTNTGSVGALFDTPIFVPPQSAILGTGTVVKRPMVRIDEDGNEVIAIRSMAYLAMSYDHRSIDGADASRFLAAVKRRIEAGEFEGDLGL